MAVSTPNPTSLRQKIRLMTMALFNPTQFEIEEAKDNVLLNQREMEPTISRVRVVRQALTEAFICCLSAFCLGAMAGAIGVYLIGPAIKTSVTIVVIGTTTLLFATLALQGWNIQSFGGATLTEQLNRWIFRSLYCVGTFLIVLGSTWSASG